ncbi:uncharacterized protein KY384_002149 [Bacidia gigantensis]|uniref:uncharacterized protein n=1 Tax=Bacidia gigantensis TaxID=2732470 RepID=UPI001D058962|nr:uncharacterized protein KY384_002149 [Bacidia gigantensis]KAG8533366.1 hypothetical protein KY384_002149 [Bacidia gigantensis]
MAPHTESIESNQEKAKEDHQESEATEVPVDLSSRLPPTTISHSGSDFYRSIDARLKKSRDDKNILQLSGSDLECHYNILHDALRSLLPADDQEIINGLEVCHELMGYLIKKASKHDMYDIATRKHMQDEFDRKLMEQKKLYERQLETMQDQLEHWHEKCDKMELQKGASTKSKK